MLGLMAGSVVGSGHSPRGTPKVGTQPRIGESEFPEIETPETAGRGLVTVRGAGNEDKNRAARCLDSILTANGQFLGKNVTHYLKNYESKMRVNLVDTKLALEGFITLVGDSLHSVVYELITSAEGDWTVFSTKMKREFFTEDADRLTRSSFTTWVQDRTKTLGPMELLREFELKLKQLPARDQKFIEFNKVETFLECAGPRMRREIDRSLDLFEPGRDEEGTLWSDLLKAVKQVGACRRREAGDDELDRDVHTLLGEVRRLQALVGAPRTPNVQPSSSRPSVGGRNDLRISAPMNQPKLSGPQGEGPPRPFRCIWCDSLEHGRKECEDFKKYFREQTVKFVDNKLAFGDSGEQIPINFGKGGMKDLVDRKLKGKGVVVNSYTFEPNSVRVQAVGVSQVGTKAWEDKERVTNAEEKSLDDEGQLGLARHLHEKTGWECPVFISTTAATQWGSWPSEEQTRSWAAGEGEEQKGKQQEPISPIAEGSEKKTLEKTVAKKEKGRGKPFSFGRDIDVHYDRAKVANSFWNQEMRGLTVGDFFGSIRKDVQEEILDKLKRRKLVRGEGGAVVGALYTTDKEQEMDDQWEAGEKDDVDLGAVPKPSYQAYVRALERWTAPLDQGMVRSNISISSQFSRGVGSEMREMCWARGCTTCEIEMRGVKGVVSALLDTGSEVNLMSMKIYKAGGWPVNRECGWEVNSVNDTGQLLWGACARVMVRIGNLVEPTNIFVHESLPHPVILGQPFITELRMETKVLDDGTHVAKLKSRDGQQEVQFPTVKPGNWRNKVELTSSPARQELEQGISENKVVQYAGKEDWVSKKFRKNLEKCLVVDGRIQNEERLEGTLTVRGEGQTVDQVITKMENGDAEVELDPKMYSQLEPYLVEVNTKYKTVAKKVRPAAVPLPVDAKELMERAKLEPRLRDPLKIGHDFTAETEDRLVIGGDGLLTATEVSAFKNMILQHGKALSFSINEMGCVDPRVVTPMIMFTVPHLPWDLKPIPVPRALLPKLVELLKEKMDAKILERSSAPYSNRWFTVKKKNGKLRFIQDMQPPNGVTIRNVGSGPVVDEFAEEFAGRAIYSMGDLFSGYDQFQLAESSRDFTTLKTPLGLLRMCTLPQGGTNCVAHMQAAMEKVLQEFIPDVTRPFLDDIPVKGCLTEHRDNSVRLNGVREFVWSHIKDVERILKRLIEVGLTLSGEKTVFGMKEILVVGQLCGESGRVPNKEKVEVIKHIRPCNSVSEVRRFLGACVFYVIWIAHFATIAEPLYRLLRKGIVFAWKDDQDQAMDALKEALTSPPVLKPLDYRKGLLIILTVDASPFGAGWAVGQDDAEGRRNAARFGAKTFDDRQRRYSQPKRELWGLKCALHQERHHLIGAPLLVETDCISLIGMIGNCSTPDIAMLRWIAFIRSFNPELRHIKGKDNQVADMLSRARFRLKGHAGCESDKESEGSSKSESGDKNQIIGQVCTGTGTEEREKKEKQGKADSPKDIPVLDFKANLYSGKLLIIGKYLSDLRRGPAWTEAEFAGIRQMSVKFFLREGFLWRRQRKGEIPLRVIGDDESRRRVLFESHDTGGAGHKGIQATYEKVIMLYWWPGVYKQVREYVQSCFICQVYSKLRHRDGLNPTCPESLHFQWGIDLVHMPRGTRGAKYLILAREDVSGYVEGRAVAKGGTEPVCRFILEDIISRYGAFGQMRADRKELNSKEARDFFKKHHIDLKLTTAYNPAANGKVERGHAPMVGALVKACAGKLKQWPEALPLALLADRTTVSTVTGFAPAELVQGYLPLMPVETEISSWRTVGWRDQVNREELLQRRIELFSQTPERVQQAIERLRAARMRNKQGFDKKHRLRPNKLEEGDWVLVADNSLDRQHATSSKFSRRWKGPYVIVKIFPNAVYRLRELDGSELANLIAGKRVKFFRRRMEGEDVYADDLEEHLEEEKNNNEGELDLGNLFDE